jgi:hypothetical protein
LLSSKRVTVAGPLVSALQDREAQTMKILSYIFIEAGPA